MILVTGASGKTGRAIINSLSANESLCAFIRNQEYAAILKSLGAERVFVGDFQDESAIRSVVNGVRAIYHICPNMSPYELEIGKSIIGAAKDAGVGHFVYHSVLHPQTEKMNHHWQKLRVEEILFESGIPFTILQPAPYMQNLLAGWDKIVNEGILQVPYSVDAKFSFIDLEDLAEAASIVLTEPGHMNAVYELAGTGPTSHAETAGIFGKMLKREVRAGKEEVGHWEVRAGKSGMSRYALENLVRMFEYYDRWGLPGNPNTLRWLLGREPNSIEIFIDRILTSTNKNG